MPARNEGIGAAEPGRVPAEASVQIRQSIETFKQDLAKATTAEEKRAVLEKWRAQREALLPTKTATARAGGNGKPAQQTLMELKIRAQNNPEMLQRIEASEQRTRDAEEMKTKLAQIQAVQGKERQELLAAFQKDRQVQAAERQKEMAVRQAEMEKARRAEPKAPLSPEAQIALARMKERKQQLELLQAALKDKDPAKRQEALNAFRAFNEKSRSEFQRERKVPVTSDEK